MSNNDRSVPDCSVADGNGALLQVNAEPIFMDESMDIAMVVEVGGSNTSTDSDVGPISEVYQARPSKSGNSTVNFSRKQYAKRFKMLRKKLFKLKLETLSMKKRLRLAKKFAKTTLFKVMNSRLTKIKFKGNKAEGRRFTLKERMLALPLYKAKPKWYQMLSLLFKLPNRRHLLELMTADTKPTHFFINQQTRKLLRTMNYILPNGNRICSLVFQEMEIPTGLIYYTKNGKFNGFVGGEDTEKHYCDHVLVFMIRGLVIKSEEPIYFSYSVGPTKMSDLKLQVKEVIMKARKMGMHVIAIVCEHTTTNIVTVNSLLEDTEKDYLNKGEKWKGGFFEVNKKKVFPLYDPAHLLIGIRNHLLKKNLQYMKDGKIGIAKWRHIRLLYRKDRLGLAWRMTLEHVEPHLIPKKDLQHCVEIISQTVASTMRIFTVFGKLPKEFEDTSELLFFFDQLFDSVNGVDDEDEESKRLRTGVTPKSPHHRFWKEALQVLKSLRFIDGTGEEISTITCWIESIERIQLMVRILLFGFDIYRIHLRNLNPGPMEKLFECLRTSDKCKRKRGAFTLKRLIKQF